VLGLSAKLYLRALSLSATPNLEVIFIILIIILNLHDPSLSEFNWLQHQTRSLGYGSSCKVVL